MSILLGNLVVAVVVESDINLVQVVVVDVVGSDTNNGRAAESVGTEETEWKSRRSLGNFVGDS